MKKILKLHFLFISSSIFIATSCKNSSKKNSGPEIAEAEISIPGISLENMDTLVNPKNDFYNYVNGNWMKNTEIPNDRTRWGGFSVLRKSTDQDVLDIIAKAKEFNQYGAETDQAKALALFQTKLDTVSRNKAGLEPLQPTLTAIENIKNISDLQTLMASNPAVSTPFMGFGVFADFNDSNRNAVYLGAAGLGLPDRDYYLDQDEKSKETRIEYKKHIVRMFKILGDTEDDAKKQANTILELETKLAETRLSKVERRDARNRNNPRTIAEVDKMLSAIDLKKVILESGMTKKFDTIIVTELKYLKTLNGLLKNTPIDDLKTIVRWDTFNSSANKLTANIETANWEFYSKYLSGQKEQRPANERALATVNRSMGEALGQLYVDEKFPPEAKQKAEKMISNVIEAYKKRIEKLDWMGDSTKIKAIEKLDKFTVKIGYPDKWEDYTKLEISSNKSYFENSIAWSKWQRNENNDEIGEPVDKSKWGMAPQIVNAYFNPRYNEIVFPAAILQPPFYNYKADEAVNYGGIGAVIGHEISHAFDDSGARFDSNGNLSNWWTDKDLENFTERGNGLAEQYSAIEVMDSVFINGKFTLGENIGDLGGVLGAYDGLQMYFAENGRPEKIDGFTPEERFFMSWVTVWRTKTRDDALRTQIKTDPHSPGNIRATQPLLNIQAFYDTFNIKEGDAMYLAPEKRVHIW